MREQDFVETPEIALGSRRFGRRRGAAGVRMDVHEREVAEDEA
jgi:hypothetical protein